MMTLGFEHGSVTEWSMRALAVLLDASVKGLVVIAAAGLAAWLMRRRSASVRHLVWSVAVAGLVVLPGLSVMLPSWQVAILPEPSAAAPVVTVDGAAALTAAEDNTELPVTEWGPDLPAAAVPSADSVEAGPDEMLAVGPPADAVSHWPVWLVAAWLMGAAAVLGHFGLGLVGLWRLTRRSVEVADGPLAEAFDELRRPFGLARLRLLRGRDGRHEMPMAWGLVRPFVFIPADSRHWSAERARVVLVHELAHIRRLDCLTQLAARLACAIYWFNPLAWLAGRWLRAEGEQACDDMVVSAGHRASDYAEHLLYIARSYRAGRRVAAATVPMARTSRIEGRLRAILDPARRRGRLTKAAVVAALAGAACVVLPLSALKATSKAHAEEAIEVSAPATQPSQDFAVTLADGVTVELVGVARNPSAESPWWRPDGTPMDQRPYQKTGSKLKRVEKQDAYEFAVRIDGADDFSYEWAIPGSTRGSITGHPMGLDGKPVLDLWAYTAAVPGSYETIDVRFGISTAPWQTVAFTDSGNASSALTDGAVMFAEPYVTDGTTAMSVAHTFTKPAVRLIAIDQQGREHRSIGTSGGGVTGVVQFTYRFPILLDRIKEFRFQTRPYRWVTFRNVSLEPGRRTDVAVEVNEPAATEDQSRTQEIPPAEGPVAVTLAFLRALETGEFQRAEQNMVPGTVKNYSALHRALDFSQVRIAEAYADGNEACVVTGVIPSRDGLRSVAMGFGLRRLGDRWLIRDGDFLPDEAAAEEFVQGFKEAHPQAQSLELPNATAASSQRAGGNKSGGPSSVSLGFRVVLNPSGSQRPPVVESAEEYVEELQAYGPAAGRERDDEFQWFAMREGLEHVGGVQAEYQGRRYVLLAGRPPYAMSTRNEPWRLKDIAVDQDNRGEPMVRIIFDEEGAQRFAELTEENIGNAVAILVDGTVVSAPVIRSKMREQAAIVGRFTEQEVQRMVEALRAGLVEDRPTRADPATQR